MNSQLHLGGVRDSGLRAPASLRPPPRLNPARLLTCALIVLLLVTCHSPLVTAQITPDSIITTVAGASWQFRGDGKPAVDAALGEILGVATDSSGNVFASDNGNHIVVKISPDGVLTVVAGNGINRFSGGDGGPATSAAMDPKGIAVGPDGSLYIVDWLHNYIRKVGLDGIITTIAGKGIPTGIIDGEGGDPFDDLGDGGRATSASLNYPEGLAVDAVGNIYINDAGNRLIRKVSLDGIITTIAGNGCTSSEVGGGCFSGDGGPATDASFNSPAGIAVDAAGNLYIADTSNDRVRKVGLDGIITTFAGDGTSDACSSGDGGPAANAQVCAPNGVDVDSVGNVYISTSIHRIYKISPDGILTTVAGIGGGDGFSGDGGPATAAQLGNPRDVAVGDGGNFYIADQSNKRVREVNAAGIIGTLAGNNLFRVSGDGGPASSSALSQPSGLALDAADNLYIAVEGNHLIRRINSEGTITTVAGNGIRGASGDGGPARSASLGSPSDVAVDSSNNVYIVDSSARLRRVSPTGTITSSFPAGDSFPSGITADATNFYYTDSDEHVVRKVSPDGTITVVAGTVQNSGFSGDGGPATSASLNGPQDVAIDAAGSLYITDGGNQRVRKVSVGGVISTVAGNGTPAFSGDGGPATSASLVVSPQRGRGHNGESFHLRCLHRPHSQSQPRRHHLNSGRERIWGIFRRWRTGYRRFVLFSKGSCSRFCR